MNALDDNSLMLKVKAGDLDKMALLYERHNRNLFGFFYKLTGSGSVSEDLVHNVFYRMLKYRYTFTEDTSGSHRFTAWMYHLARNVNADHYKKQKKVSYTDDMEPWERKLKVDENAHSQMAKSQDLELLQKAIKHLAPEKQEMLILTKYQGMKYEQVADIFGITEGAVKVRMHRVLQELREAYLKLEKV
ncbi:RNA polymerase sigma factor [uncultured Imperialibacter sp.]|uniref:RNA polymerase sigma factor n=1 Tax=uncultured Imperialibacter sp. TaxID=1672639 RepID=UPI0030DD813F